jgi:hypothetical protein
MHHHKTTTLAALLALLTTLAFIGDTGPARAKSDRVELGDVDWHRDFEEAKAEAERTGKPMFVLFTEVPGCATVRGYGKRVLSHRLIVEAIEREFVPVAVFNNVEGDDRKILNSFGEPTWNNPAVRIIEPDRDALAPRLYGDYSPEATVATIIEALESADTSVPRYLKLLDRELAAAGRTETAVFGMYCFWSGEAKLGRLDGVVKTRPGFMKGTEVVEVTYDPKRTSLSELAERARETGAASSFYARNDEEFEAAREAFGDSVSRTDDDFRYAEDDDNYQMRGTPYADVPMTHMQETLVNSALASGSSPERHLSPGQCEQVEND